MRDGVSVKQHATRRVALFVAVCALALPLTGCGLADKSKLADRIIDSADRAVAAGTAKLSMTESYKLDFGKLSPEQVRRESVKIPPETVEAVADLKAERVQFQVGEGEEVVPFQILDRHVYYRWLPSLGPASKTRRSWLKLDYKNLSDEVAELDEESALDHIENGVNPAHLVALLRGVLTGSVEARGTEEVRGVKTSRYKVNFDREKATRAWEEEDLDAFNGVLAAMRVPKSQVVLPGDAWLDDQGLLRRMRVRFDEKFPRRAEIQLTITLDLFDFGKPVTISLPKRDEVAEVNGFRVIKRELDAAIREVAEATRR